MPKGHSTFYLGTAIEITTVLNRDNPTSVKITIEDGSDTVKVNAVAMTQVQPNVYNYIYQTSTSDNEGVYDAVIDAVYGAYTAKSMASFELIEADTDY